MPKERADGAFTPSALRSAKLVKTQDIVLCNKKKRQLLQYVVDKKKWWCYNRRQGC